MNRISHLPLNLQVVIGVFDLLCLTQPFFRFTAEGTPSGFNRSYSKNFAVCPGLLANHTCLCILTLRFKNQCQSLWCFSRANFLAVQADESISIAVHFAELMKTFPYRLVTFALQMAFGLLVCGLLLTCKSVFQVYAIYVDPSLTFENNLFYPLEVRHLSYRPNWPMRNILCMPPQAKSVVKLACALYHGNRQACFC